MQLRFTHHPHPRLSSSLALPSLPPASTCSVEQPGIVAGELDPLLTVLGSVGQSTDFFPGGIPVLDGPQKGPLHAGTCHSSGPQPVMPHNCPCSVLWKRQDRALVGRERSLSPSLATQETWCHPEPVNVDSHLTAAQLWALHIEG